MKALRSISAIILAVITLMSSTSFLVGVHYCGGKISSISSGFSNKETCEIPKAEAEKACCAKKADRNVSELAKQPNHKKCCSDKTVNLKGKAIDILAKVPTSDFTAPFMVPVFKSTGFDATPVLETRTLPAYYCDSHAPPLFKLYQQYILYA